MKKILLLSFLVCSLFVASSPLLAQDNGKGAKVTSLMTKPLPDMPDQKSVV